MSWNLPTTVIIDNVEHKIRNECDYRVVLDCISALKDNELDEKDRIRCALFIFYEDFGKIKNFETAVKEMYKIIDYNDYCDTAEEKPCLMDWEHDFKQIAPPISRTLGYDVRLPNKYTHWWTLLGGYFEIGECTWNTVVSIRSKKIKHKKLDKFEEDFYRENRSMVELPQNITKEEQEWLDADW